MNLDYNQLVSLATTYGLAATLADARRLALEVVTREGARRRVRPPPTRLTPPRRAAGPPACC